MDSAKYHALPFRYKIARFSLLLHEAYPFLGELCMRVEKHKKETIAIAATDGYRLYLNEAQMDTLPEESFNFVLLHELFHIILRHRYPQEAQFHEKKYWNISFDLVVNWLLMSMDYELRRNNLPVAPIANTFLCRDDLSEDTSHKIAPEFVRQAKQQGVLSDHPPIFVEIKWKTFMATIPNTADFMFDVLDNDDILETPTEADIQELLASCVKAAGKKGLPWLLQGLMDKVMEGRKLPWFHVLKRYLEASKNAEDYSFYPPDKRLLYSGMILPSEIAEDKALQNALIVLDVSSSVNKEELLAQIWQIKMVLSDCEFSGSVLSFGSGIYQEALLTDKTSLKRFIDALEVGGGTDWAEVVLHVQQEKSGVKPIIVFTDGLFFSFDPGLTDVIFIVQRNAPEKLRKLGKVIEVYRN